MRESVCSVLFLCTGNSARSVIAESALRRFGGARFAAWSAGSRPTGKVNPFTLAFLAANGFPVDGLRSKSWEEFAAPGAPGLDVVITVCDGAAGETCPVWPSQPMTVHWCVPDPAAVEGTDDEKRRAFAMVARILIHRIGLFAGLPLERLDRPSLRERLRGIGKTLPAP